MRLLLYWISASLVFTAGCRTMEVKSATVNFNVNFNVPVTAR